MKTYMFAGVLSLGLFALAAKPALADEEHKNLKVLQDTKKEIETGMKSLAKGLDMKCTGCHVKGEFDSDKVAAKEDTRKFLSATVGEKDAAKRSEALATLLKALNQKEAKNAAAVWSAVDLWKKK